MKQRTSAANPPASAAGKVAGVLFLVVAAFQAALAVGAPWGEAAYGGGNPGVLPENLRGSSAIATVVYLFLAGVAGTRFSPPTLRRRLLLGASGLMAVGAVMNLASPSLVERLIWTPVTIVLVVALWRASRHESIANPKLLPATP
ncbi:MAG TPA: hypothetical protein VEX88_12775 [Glaciibacter sp.]|nr:hypothetical protein [Glaciibacter sp.]